MFNDIYKDKTVLVTGHTGFKGSWLSVWLKALGANVVGYSLEPPSTPNNFDACGLSRKLTHIHGDIRELHHLKKVFQQHKPY
jgi:CDP-glucose 4,6-dehydratase